jgi:cellulose biosynthesis protein BcsQ
MRTLAIVNLKGGSCKSTTAVSLAACLGEKGRRVLLVDLDPAGNATWWLGAAAERGTYDVLVKGLPLADAAVQENVRLAGELANMEAGTNGLLELLAALLDAWREDGNLAPVLDAVAEELKRRRRTN